MKALTKREQDLIALLLNSKEIQSGDSISILLGVTSRTIRNDIKKLDHYLKDFGANIISYRGRGYKIEVYDYHKFENIKRKISNLPESGALAKLIIEKLLINTFTDTILYQQDLADSLFVSLSTLKNSLPKASDELKKIKLEIRNDKKDGISIFGDEDRIRFAISEYIFNNGTNSYQNYSYLFPINEMDKIKEIIKDVLSRHHLILTDLAVNGLIVHIMIAISRPFVSGISFDSDEEQLIKTTEEYTIAKEIIKGIQKQLGIDINTEVFYLARHLVASGRLTNCKVSKMDKDNENFIISIIDSMMKSIKEKTSIDFSKDEELISSLATHLSVALHRIKFNMNIRNEFISTIKNEYPLAFDLAVIASKEIEKIIGINIEENEIGFIAIHFGASLERRELKSSRTKKIIVVCGSGLATASLIKKG